MNCYLCGWPCNKKLTEFVDEPRPICYNCAIFLIEKLSELEDIDLEAQLEFLKKPKT